MAKLKVHKSKYVGQQPCPTFISFADIINWWSFNGHFNFQHYIRVVNARNQR